MTPTNTTNSYHQSTKANTNNDITKTKKKPFLPTEYSITGNE
jgi:hypothetical protein